MSYSAFHWDHYYQESPKAALFQESHLLYLHPHIPSSRLLLQMQVALTATTTLHWWHLSSTQPTHLSGTQQTHLPRSLLNASGDTQARHAQTQPEAGPQGVWEPQRLHHKHTLIRPRECRGGEGSHPHCARTATAAAAAKPAQGGPSRLLSVRWCCVGPSELSSASTGPPLTLARRPSTGRGQCPPPSLRYSSPLLS